MDRNNWWNHNLQSMENRFHFHDMNVFGRDTIDYSVNSIFVDNKNRHWFSTDFYGLRIADPSTGESTVIEAISNLSINGLLFDKRMMPGWLHPDMELHI